MSLLKWRGDVRKPFELQGRTLTEKMEHVERMFKRIIPRLGTKVIGVIPPVPFMHYCAEPQDAVIAKMLIPVSGVLDMAYIRIDKYDAQSADLSLSVSTGNAKSVVVVTCNRPAHSFTVSRQIRAGDLIEVMGEGVHGIHIAFTVQPAINRATKENYILEGLLALLGDDNGLRNEDTVQ